MMTKNDGGPAFPVADNVLSSGSITLGGMTLRDYFAVAAMQGLLARHKDLRGEPIDTAQWAYEYADAMLAERSK